MLHLPNLRFLWEDVGTFLDEAPDCVSRFRL
jgi:hypothetical protein